MNGEEDHMHLLFEAPPKVQLGTICLERLKPLFHQANELKLLTEYIK